MNISSAVAPPTSAELAAVLRGRLGYRRMSRAELAERLGVEPSWVYRRLSGTTPLTVDDLALIAAVLGPVVSRADA